MAHDRTMRALLFLVFIALTANVFRPQIQRLLAPPVSAQEADKATPTGLRVAGDLIVEGQIIAKRDIRLDGNLAAQGSVQAAQVDAGQIKAKSAAVAERLTAGTTIQCRDLTVEKMLSAQNAQISQTLSADNVAAAKDMQVAGTAFIENIAVRELKGPNEALDASRPRIIDEIVARIIVVTKAIERP